MAFHELRDHLDPATACGPLPRVGAHEPDGHRAESILGPASADRRNGAIELRVARLAGVDELDQHWPASILGEFGHQGLAEH